MTHQWLKSYPAGMPDTIDPDVYPSLVALFESAFRNYSDRPAFANLGRTLTFAEVEIMTSQFAGWLQGKAKLKPGDRIALMLPNSLQYAVALIAALRAGLVVVNVNPLYTPRELRHQLNDSGATAIVIMENFAHVLAEVRDDSPLQHVVVTAMGDLLPFPKSLLVNTVLRHVKKAVPPFNLEGTINFRDAMREGGESPFDHVSPSGDDLAFLQYTGGTTGVSKGAMLTHRNLVANLQQMGIWIKDLDSAEQQVIITALPMYHVYSLVVNVFGFLQIGGLNVLISNPRDINAFVKEMARWKFTAITGVNTLYNALLHHPEFHKLDFSTLQLCSGGGMAMQRAVSEKWASVTGKPILEGYGLTETSPVVCGNRLDTTEAFTGNVGLPYPSTEVSIRLEDGSEAPTGDPGELWVRGPQVMKGYWGRDEATRDTITDDGWLKTGDVATMDEAGFVKLVDRKKDMIIVSGFNVFPNEIEDIVGQCDGVLEAACVGIDDAKQGESVKVFVVREPGASVTAEAIVAHCRKLLTGYKVPRHVEFLDELPKSPIGKILRRELRVQAQTN